MKRIHLFELEDFGWFPPWLRACMTRLIMVMHRTLRTREELAELLAPALRESGTSTIIDMCSGSGGPMLDVMQILDEKHGLSDIKLVLTDLHPDLEAARRINGQGKHNISYRTTPLDATRAERETSGLRTMIGSFHHMKPDDARRILESAQASRQPICIFEISDNSTPTSLWWVALPVNFVMCLFITLAVRPMTWRQLVFTYVIPIIPLCFAWDGAVSNARVYTLDDMRELLGGLEREDYTWRTGATKGKLKKLYLLGLPVARAGASG